MAKKKMTVEITLKEWNDCKIDKDALQFVCSLLVADLLSVDIVKEEVYDE